MINRRNCSRCTSGSKEMKDYSTQMGLNEFVGTAQSAPSNIDNAEKMADMPIAMAYVPWQQWRMIYEAKEALKRGTIFKELDLPFEASKGCK